MKLPKTLDEALKQGWKLDGGESTESEDGKTATGNYELVKEGKEPLQIPFKATFTFGQPRHPLWKKKQRELLWRLTMMMPTT